MKAYLPTKLFLPAAALMGGGFAAAAGMIGVVDTNSFASTSAHSQALEYQDATYNHTVMFSQERQFLVPPPSRIQPGREIRVRPFYSEADVFLGKFNIMETRELHPKKYVYLCDFVRPTSQAI